MQESFAQTENYNVGSYGKMDALGLNPHSQRKKVIQSTIDALLEIRLSLSVKKIIGSTIKRSELNNIVSDVKQKILDLKVVEEINKVFDEYLNVDEKKVIPNAVDIWNSNAPILKDGVVAKIDKEVNERNLSLEEMESIAKEEGAQTGTAKTLTSNYNSRGTMPNLGVDFTSTVQ